MLRRTIISILSLVLLGVVFFSGSAPDFTYRLLPGYFADDEQAWSETPLDFGQVTEGRLPEAVIEK